MAFGSSLFNRYSASEVGKLTLISVLSFITDLVVILSLNSVGTSDSFEYIKVDMRLFLTSSSFCSAVGGCRIPPVFPSKAMVVLLTFAVGEA